MADNLSSRGAEARYPNGDPFAELSRIIGAAPAGRNAPPADEDFDLDLERELIGEAEFEGHADNGRYADERHAAPQAQPAVHQRDEFADPLADDFADAFEAEFGATPGTASSWDAPVHAQPEADAPEADPAAVLAQVDMDFGDLDMTDEVPALEEAPQPLRAAPLSLEDELSAMLTGSAPARHDAGIPAQHHMPEAPAFSADDDYQPQPYAEGPYETADSLAYGAGPAAVDDDRWDVGAADAEPRYEAIAEEPVYEATPEPEPAEPDPFAVFAAMAPVAPALSAAGRFSRAPAPAPVAPVAADPHDFTTVDVDAATVPVQDDLDLPAVPQPEEAAFAPALDDDYDFGELALDASKPVTAQASQAAYDQQAYDQQRFDDEYLTPSPDDALYAEYAQTDAVYDDQTPPMVAETPREPVQERRGKGMLIAAVVVGIAVVGGIGAFALSFGDSGGTSGTTLVRADDEPLKVRPENPGGASVPNQNSQAYERVAEGQATAAPEQERLVTTAEQPVSLATRAEPANGLPGVDDEIGELEAAPLAAPKAEDRVAATTESEGVGAQQDLVAVQPRRVRTMVVRPDGTLVPREEAAPQMVAAAPQSALAPVADAPAESIAATAGNAVREAGQPTGMPAPRSVETVRITPEAAPTAQGALNPAGGGNAAAAAPQAAAPQAAAPQAAATEAQAPQVAEPAPRPAEPARAETQVAQAAAPARAQPAAPVAPQAAGEWSMQIASQPTAEGAQATYQDLARRYGSVLGGRGVNVVRADIPGKGTYYRVRIPSSTRAEAVSLCERYKAAGGSCFVSK
jgi:hypothetical protein